MAESTSRERIQPCLLDRLTDEEPTNTQESRTSRTMSIARYKNGVLRDILALLRANQHLEEEGWADYPEVLTSVVNFGTPNIFGLGAASLDSNEIERKYAQAIKAFEPRINSDSLEISANRDIWAPGTEMSLEIRGDVWAHPIPEQLYIKTRMDIETGEVKA